ncbi:MAG: Uma2 family endonuclease [Cyanobacteria bacterium P01_F01_bin.4]
MTLGVAAFPKDLVWRMGIDQYHAMIDAGILTDDDPVELLEGLLIFKMPKNPPHRATTRLVRSNLEKLVPADWYVDSQEPITLIDSEPEPDIVLGRGDTLQYLDRHPGSGDIALVIEVSDSTLQRDRTTKKRAYARAGIPFYWIVNLIDTQVEVYSQPVSQSDVESDYSQQRVYQGTEQIAVVIEETVVGAVAIASILPAS